MFEKDRCRAGRGDSELGEGTDVDDRIRSAGPDVHFGDSVDFLFDGIELIQCLLDVRWNAKVLFGHSSWFRGRRRGRLRRWSGLLFRNGL